MLKALFGQYACVISSETLIASKSGQQTNDLARLPGVRLALASELEDGLRWNEALIKSLTGGDTFVARFLYREFFEFVPVFKLFVAGNHRPVVRGTDEGFWRRFQLVPFNVFRRKTMPTQEPAGTGTPNCSGTPKNRTVLFARPATFGPPASPPAPISSI